MPNKFDKMYQVSGGDNPILETVIFLEESLADPSCTVTTYLMRDSNGRKFRCSKDYYYETPKQAWEKHLKDCLEAYEPTYRQLEEAQKQLDWLNNETKRVAEIVRGFTVSEFESDSQICDKVEHEIF